MSNGTTVGTDLSQIPLKRISPAGDAGLWTVSLPLPAGADQDLALGTHPTYTKQLGRWTDDQDSSPRRLLMVAQAPAGPAPDTCHLSPAQPSDQQHTPTAEPVLIEDSGEPLFIWECHALRLHWGQHAVEIIMGLKTNGEIHWWEAAQLEVIQDTPSCRTVEMGGAIPLIKNGLKEWVADSSLINPLLHKHNWLNGHLAARLHANGVCEIFAHHINSKFFDDGLPLENATPVIGIRVDGAIADISQLTGPWDGTQTDITLGDVKLDLSDAAPLASATQPGQMSEHDGFLVWQPYMGVELYGGEYSRLKGGDGYFFHPEDNIIPRGMARTVRFSLSLSPAASPSVARYLPPAWWFGACSELSPAPFLPISNEYDHELTACRHWMKTFMTRHGFEDGALPRSEYEDIAQLQFNGWEGEMPYTQFLSAYRTGNPDQYHDALRQAYYFNDVCIDHAAKAARMPGYPPNAFALPHARVLGSVAAYLETGDEYLLDTAEAVIETAHRTHRNSWPRMAVGRDASYIRGAVMLFRYFRKPQFRDIAQKGISNVITAQRQDGSFGDQGGGSGLHQFGTYISKPWMGCMATSGLIDWLELYPEHEAAAACVKRFADWLMAERFPHLGGIGWTYQHNYNGENLFFNYQTGDPVPLKHEESAIWHQEYFARIMMFSTLRFHDPAYLQAWQESFRLTHSHENKRFGDHRVAQALQYLPWLQDRLWRVELTPDGLFSRPVHFGQATPTQATLHGPNGPVDLHWTPQNTCTASTPDLRFRNVTADPIDLTPFIARGFPGDFDDAVANVGVAGIDRQQAQSMIRLCDETEAYLYDGPFSPRHVTYQPGTRPQLQAIAQQLPGDTPYAIALAAMSWVFDHVQHPFLCGRVKTDRAMTEEQLIDSGAGWCNEQTRVFTSLCQLRNIPARLLFQFHANGRSGHTVAELFICGRWVFFDPTFKVTVRLPDNSPAEGRDLSGPFRYRAHHAYSIALKDAYPLFLPFVETIPGWKEADRPKQDAGGDLFGHLGICNYLTDGVSATDN